MQAATPSKWGTAQRLRNHLLEYPDFLPSSFFPVRARLKHKIGVPSTRRPRCPHQTQLDQAPCPGKALSPQLGGPGRGRPNVATLPGALSCPVPSRVPSCHASVVLDSLPHENTTFILFSDHILCFARHLRPKSLFKLIL